ncbi:aldehyde dehydrogenase [Chromohalobacter israelensis]|uniref:aldehyde dehydrogenase n=1 Tax=Chromohalobacter israelensis TaxID=141390 RepID=UPI001CC67556|nr:aldehyde dehydrogenase [Chromohalobacter salexigens]MBZ5876306.1 aldehyde dehydrogenase [Chromohalobacter salexigens]
MSSDNKTYQNYINGAFVEAREHLEVRNPANGELVSRVPASGPAEVEKALSAAHEAQPSWARLPAVERASYLRLLADKIRSEAKALARVITEEQGKVSGLAEVEVNFTADYLDYMAEWARRIEGEIIESDRPGENIFLFRKPLGVVAGILPWNFPFFLIARKMAPALVTGNTVVIKPSEETPNNCFEFTRLLDQVGLPAGVFNVVSGDGASTGQALTASPLVDMVSFTGSVETGSRIMRSAADNITKVNLELGGKAPAIVLDDADIDLAVKAIRDSRIINTGQVCNCAERVYVQRGVAGEFTDKIARAMADTSYGDPLTQSDIEMGPLINQQGLDKVAAMVERATQDGAELVTGGRIADLGAGFHYQPTVLSGCHNDMEIMRKEIFGPVLPIQIVDDLDEAIALANDSDYGLTSSVYTRSLARAMHACREIDYGETYINRENFEAMQGFHAGTRKSGIGGADGKHGLYEYTRSHVVYLET